MHKPTLVVLDDDNPTTRHIIMQGAAAALDAQAKAARPPKPEPTLDPNRFKPVRHTQRGVCGGRTPLPSGKQWLPHFGERQRQRLLRQQARAELKALKKEFGVTVNESNGELVTESGLVLPTRAKTSK